MNRNQKKPEKGQHAGKANFYMRYAYLLVFIIPFLVLFTSVRNGFVYFDDDILILDNQARISDLSNIGSAFHSDAFFNNSSPYYRPLLTVSLMIDAQVAKANPGFYHFMNLVYHGLCCLGLLWFLTLIGIKRELAFAGTLLFSVHPVMASAVFWIPARNDLLVTLFGLLFLSLSITWFRARKPAVLCAAILAYAAAIFSKESAIILPFLLALYLLSTGRAALDKERVLLFLGLVLVTAGWFFLRMASVRMAGTWQLGMWAVIANIPFPIEIIAKFFFPFNLAVTPVYTSIYTGLGVLCIAVILAGFLMRKQKVIWLFIFGLTWYILFSLPNMFVRLDTSPDSYDYLIHRAYLPAVGLVVALLSLVPEYWLRATYKRAALIFVALFIFLAANSVFLGTRYRDAKTFWNSAIAYKPEKAWFHHFLGRYYFKQQDYVTFEKHLRKAISLKRHPRFLYNLSMVYFLEKKSYDTAFILFNEARATGFTDPEANVNYIKLCIESARNFFEKGAYKEAADRCRIAVDHDPDNPVAAYNLGLYHVYCGEMKRAAACWRRSISLDPELTEAYRSLYYYYLNNTSNKDSIDYFAREFRRRGGTL